VAGTTSVHKSCFLESLDRNTLVRKAQEQHRSYKASEPPIGTLQSVGTPHLYTEMDQSSNLKRSAACLGSSSRPSPCSAEKRAAFGDYHHTASVSRSGGSSEPFITSRTTQKPAAVQRVRTYKRSDLAAFNLLANRPIWVFDVARKEMWWGNDAACELWNASSLQVLLDRDFSDMSESTCKRLNEYMAKFQRGEQVSDRVGGCMLSGTRLVRLLVAWSSVTVISNPVFSPPCCFVRSGPIIPEGKQ